jgi:hypothetical protein
VLSPILIPPLPAPSFARNEATGDTRQVHRERRPLRALRSSGTYEISAETAGFRKAQTGAVLRISKPSRSISHSVGEVTLRRGQCQRHHARHNRQTGPSPSTSRLS